MASIQSISGAEAIAENRVDLVFPESRRAVSKFMSNEQADDMRNWLIEPDYATVQRKPIELDSTQRSYVTSRTQSGYRRIKGPAGSGKSLNSCSSGGTTTWRRGRSPRCDFQYHLASLSDGCGRKMAQCSRPDKARNRSNFHAWCKRVCVDSDHEQEYLDLWRGSEDAARF